MSGKISRRSFIKTGATIGAASLLGTAGLSRLAEAAVTTTEKGAAVDICAVKGSSAFLQTQKAIEILGGIGKFVSKGDRVALLANAVRNTPGANVSPDILAAVIDLCLGAGAKDIRLIKDVPGGYWNLGTITKTKPYADQIQSLSISKSSFRIVPVPKGVNIKEAHIDADLMDFDRFINVGIVKHHSGVQFTATLKNLMGACPHNPTNRFFHMGHSDSAQGFYDNVDFLSQCIADLNTIRKPDLCLIDATTFLTSNGPFGPGDTDSANMVVAGINPVSVDAYSTRFLKLAPKDVPMILYAEKHGLGSSDLSKQTVREISV